MRKILAAALVLSVVVVAAGCGNTNKVPDTGGARSSGLPAVVRIGTQQIPNDETLAIAKGYFQKELGTKVNIVDFQAGDIRNAMISGSIDFAMLGSSSAALGIGNGMGVNVIWIHDIIGDSERLVARNGSGIRSVSDLKGKTIATAFTSTAHYSLLKALEQNGLSEKDVKLIDMQMNDLYAAWKRGEIDAAYAWQPTLSYLLKDGKTIVSSRDMAANGVPTSNVEFVRRGFSEKYPNAVTGYIRALTKAVDLYRQDEHGAVAAVASYLNITQDEARTQMQECTWLSAPEQLTPDYMGTSAKKGSIAKSLKDTADFMYQQKSLKAKPQQSVFDAAVNPSFIEKAVQQ